jgi:putative acyl-CoA dehydrogenase
MVAEALECLGGNGFVEDFPMARLLRDSPLNSIWEGSGNVIALDVLRAVARDPNSLVSLMDEVGAGQDQRLAAFVTETRHELEGVARDPGTAPYTARRIVERLALSLQASLVVRHSPGVVAEAFLASRIGAAGGRAFGTLPGGLDCATVIERHRPRLS